MPYVWLVISWIAWCVLHSALIAFVVTDRLRRKAPKAFRYYRILYNLFAVVSLLPILFYTFSLRGAPVVAWTGLWRIVPILMGAAALFFFIAGGRRYDFLQFLGLRQIKQESTCSVLTEDCSLDTGGILSVVRHPWYSAGLLVVWARPLDVTAIVTNLVVCGYFVVGAILEERKLKAHFGSRYADYQQRVSMFFPIKWARRRFSGKP
jgi:methanethiol S-methyltransferase